jgi:hypothetical protein
MKPESGSAETPIEIVRSYSSGASFRGGERVAQRGGNPQEILLSHAACSASCVNQPSR